MFIDLSPLRRYPDFRWLFLSQSISFLGSMMSYVAVPYQVFELTKSSWLVGLVSGVQLIPLLLFGLWGGSVADRFDRQRLLIGAELLMGVGALALGLNSLSSQASATAIFVIAALMQAVNAFHRPAMDALSQKLVNEAEYASLGALNSLRHSAGAIVGPALGPDYGPLWCGCYLCCRCFDLRDDEPLFVAHAS